MHSGEALDELPNFSGAWLCEKMRALSALANDIERVGASRTRSWIGMGKSYGRKPRSRIMCIKEHGYQYSCKISITTINYDMYHALFRDRHINS